ncbi:MAG: hypothetical protein ACTHN5_08680 [Phycisphaerae bacterium]
MNESETSAGLSPEQKTVRYAPGSVVRITQQIPRRTDTVVTTVTGTVMRQERQPSGSWYARNAGSKVWLDRLVIRKEDGEITILNLDEYTVVEVIRGPEAVRAESPLVVPARDAAAGLT